MHRALKVAYSLEKQAELRCHFRLHIRLIRPLLRKSRLFIFDYSVAPQFMRIKVRYMNIALHMILTQWQAR